MTEKENKPADTPQAQQPAAAGKKEEKKKVATAAAKTKTAKVNGDESPYGLVSKIVSHDVTYTKITISRPTGDKLKKGARYDVKLAADGTITLKPSKPASARRR